MYTISLCYAFPSVLNCLRAFALKNGNIFLTFALVYLSFYI